MGATGRDIAHFQVWFYGRPRGPWERIWFKPGFRHCIAFAWLETDRWLEIDPRLPRQRLRVLTGPQYVKRMTALTRLGALSVQAPPQAAVRSVPRVATCAGVIAHILGVRSALLPFGLYRALAPIPEAAGVS